MTPDSELPVEVELTFPRQVNWSLLQAGIPLVWDLAVRNPNDAPIPDPLVRLALPPYLEGEPVALPELGPREQYAVCGDQLRWNQRHRVAANRATGAVSGALVVRVGTHEFRPGLEILAPDEWCVGLRRTSESYALDSTVDLWRVTAVFPPGRVMRTEAVARPWDGLAATSGGRRGVGAA